MALVKDLKVHVHTPDGMRRPVEAPPYLKTGQFLREVVEGFGLPAGADWSLHDQDIDRTLDDDKTLEENGVREGHHLHLRDRGGPRPGSIPVQSEALRRCENGHFYDPAKHTACPYCGVIAIASVKNLRVYVHTPDGMSSPAEAPPDLKTGQFLREVVEGFGLPARAHWSLHDQDIDRTLDDGKTLEENGVREGHHLHLRERGAIRVQPEERVAEKEGQEVLKRCENGHFYDPAKHTTCPYCSVADIEIEPTARKRSKKKRDGRTGTAHQPPPGAVAPETDEITRAVTPGRPGIDPVHFAVSAPPAVRPGVSFVTTIWAHLEGQRKEVERRVGGDVIQTVGPAPVTRGTILSIRLDVGELAVQDSECTVLWVGEIARATFSVAVPKTARKGPHLGVARVYASGLKIASVHFTIQVESKTSRARRIPTREERPSTAFASYAGEDRDAVLARIQGMHKAAPELDVFLDVLKLRSGEDWAKRLWQEIPSRDIFYLFWSEGARRSDWVEKEWRCALQRRGLDFIDPVPLVSPEEVPPPPELASKHFNDWVLAFMRRPRL